MSTITLRFLVEPGDLGPDHRVAGGTVVKWIDQAGHACASAWAQGPCATVYLSSIRFQRTLRLGDMVEVQARLAFTGRTNMNIMVELLSGSLARGALIKTAECLAVYLALDAQGEPQPVDSWTPGTPGEMALASSAREKFDATRPAPLE
ncbi:MULTISPECIES: acyl-CoA thioesterase [Hydrogenophaga]|uniref:Acyl-CoA thioesterase n=1 Tax=Hydrogenophaga electricum TaxID=1230953 RepID=A0ABQ6CAU3_9BURK|nr:MULTISPECIES: hotdog domain-containing protein [Hydrogenophaga]GLS16924.1 acyl-CoA thioesterase [Hydrogenophaga electricum]